MLQLLQAADWIAFKPQSDWSKIHTSLVHPKVQPKPIKPIKLALSSCRHSRILELKRFEKRDLKNSLKTGKLKQCNGKHKRQASGNGQTAKGMAM